MLLPSVYQCTDRCEALLVSPSKFLPSMYTIRGLRAAQGLIFLDILSAESWLYENKIELKDHMKIKAAEVIYYGGALKSKTTEEIMLDRKNTG